MQNSPVFTTKNSALISLNSSSLAAPNSSKPVEATGGFQQMFSKQLQQDQKQSDANKMNARLNTKPEETQAPAPVKQPQAQAALENNAASTDKNTETDQKENAKSEENKSADTTSATQQAGNSKTTQHSKVLSEKDKLIADATLKADIKSSKTGAKKVSASDESQQDGITQKEASAVQPDASLMAAIPATPVLMNQIMNTLPKDNATTQSAEQSVIANLNAKPTTKSDELLGQAFNAKGSNDEEVDATKNKFFTDLTDVKIDAGKEALGKESTGKQQWLENILAKGTQNTDAEKLLNTKLIEAMPQNAADKIVMPQAASLYQASSNLAAVNAASQVGSSNAINAYPGKTGWDQAISQKVVWMVGSGEQSATLNLNPPDLGPLQVVINVNNDKADTTFISQNVEVRKALEDGMSTLRDMMGQAGIQLGQANVSANSQQQQTFEQSSKNNASQFGSQASNQTSERITSSTMVTRTANGLVDTFA